jgi:ABC-type multidrug transport system fused ATPase/permease subunit
MRLLRDIWSTSPRRTAVVAWLIILGAAGQAGASALAGAVLLDRSFPLFVVLAAALVVAVMSDVSVGLIMSRLTADWTAAVRRGLCRVALGQDLPTLENTPVGELLDRIDNDVYQVGAQLPSARVWTRRTVAMGGESAYSASVPGVDISAGTAPAPPAMPRHPLRTLDLASFSAVHEDGTVGANDIHLTIHRGQLVLVVGPVGSGKSSLLRAMAGIVHHTARCGGTDSW